MKKLTYYRKGVCVNYKKLKDEIITRDDSHKEFRVNGFTLGIELRSFFQIKSISLIRHSSLLRYFLRILKFSSRFDGLQFKRLMKEMDLFSLYVLFSHFRPRDILMEIFLLFFSYVMRTFARAQDDIRKKLFPRVASLSVKSENKTYKLKGP